MDLTDKRIGFAMTGSFCTFKKVLLQLEELVKSGADVTPIMSKTAFSTDTRFGTAENFRWQIENLCSKPILSELCEVEPIGPRSLLDLLIIAPCTGNTLAKLANGITDSSVTLAAKAHLRNKAPILVAVSTNDGLGNAAKNIGTLLNSKYIYFVPFGQDDYKNKPNSLVADMTLIPSAAQSALELKQLQPVLIR